MKMSDEPYTIIHLGNPYDFVIKNINEPETYGTFQGDKESMEEFIEKVNSIIKENDELKASNEGLLKDLNYGFKLIKSVEKENDELKTELFEARKELLWATSDEVDRALYYEDEVEELRKEIFNDGKTI